MRRFEISTSQRLNVVGWFGAVSFIFSPFLEAVGYWGLMRELANTSYSRDFLEPGVFLVLGSVGFLGGLVMVIVGRDQNHIVREVDSDPTKRLWAPDEGRWIEG